MNRFDDVVRCIINVNKWIAFITLVLMVPLVTFFAVARGAGMPVVGGVELVQFSMVIVIVTSLAYTEATNAHISIGILADKLPASFQLFLDLVAQTITYLFGFFICWVFISNMNYSQASNLLTLPFWPFKMLLIIGFFGWGLEAFMKFTKSIHRLMSTSE